ncbi:FtsX-like permease family protein [Roseivirga sp. BDSF3-8]|uniref:ABC transporter permease n=1 Tax=Roseivirga sp. BDSF3-8 TaxID=3241598 RepID=UPI0035318087
MFINIFGLICGVVSFLLIINYVHYQLSFDTFSEDSDRLYRISLAKSREGVVESETAYTDVPLGSHLHDNVAGIEEYFRLHFTVGEFLLSPDQGPGSPVFKESKAYFADKPALDYLDIQLLRGNSSTALGEPSTILISEHAAEKYYGSGWKQKDIIGQTLVYTGDNAEHLFRIDGVFEDYPDNAHLEFDFLFSHESLYSIFGGGEMPPEMVAGMMENMWGHPQWYTYLALSPGTDPADVELNINYYIQELRGEQLEKEGIAEAYKLQPIEKIHLYSDLTNEPRANGDIRIVLLLAGVAILILALAWTNYVNLSIILSTERVKEIGLRKTVGAERNSLAGQFAMESFMLNIIVVALAIAIYAVLLPLFSAFLSVSIITDWHLKPFFWIEVALIVILGTFFTGFHSSIVLSGINPREALSGKLRSGISGGRFKKVLVGTQFVITIVLVMSALIIYRQIDFMQDKDLGIRISGKLVITAPKKASDHTQFINYLNTFRDRLSDNSAITAVSATTFIPGQRNLWQKKMVRMGQKAAEGKDVKEIGVEPGYLEQLDVEFLRGSSFSANEEYSARQVVLNEEAVRLLGYQTPDQAISEKVGVIYGGGNVAEYEVAGVLKDFHHSTPKAGYEPLAFFTDIRTGYFIVESNQAGQGDLVESVRAQWQSLFPDEPFEYFFLKDYYANQYASDQQFIRIFSVFTFIAILVASLGVFGLTKFMAQKKAREISIRKVYGATIGNISTLFAKYFLQLVIVASIIGIPIAYFITDEWLESYAFKQKMYWWLFLLPILFIITIAGISSCYGTLKAALRNPIHAMRNE